ncbi:hypothetical protein C8Q75DRAFT_718060, partial [Abortiporus biennis]
VTGASSGFGRCMTEYILSRGEIAVATLRGDPSILSSLTSKYPTNQLLILKLDVTDSLSVSSAFNSAKETFGRIDVVFNNAGYAIIGEIQGTDEKLAKDLFECNFWGSSRVSKEAVKIFREVNKPVGGRLLINSSISGLNPVPGLGYYGASKFAVEGFTQALASELNPDWNIKVTLIEPGMFSTKAIGQNAISLPTLNPSTCTSINITRERLHQASLGKIEGVGSPMKAVQRFYDLANLDEPPLRFVIGKDAIKRARMQLDTLERDIKMLEAWSEDLADE